MNSEDQADDFETGSLPDSDMRLRLAVLMRDAALMMRRRFMKSARETGLPLNQSEASMLVHVAHQPGLRQAALSAQMDIEPIALVRLLDSLEAAGLVERKFDHTDRRVRTVWPTKAAIPVLAQIDEIRKEVRQDALRGMPDANRQQLVQSLLKIRTNLA
jgi:DNA-binding MarR family transcriptional regulator